MIAVTGPLWELIGFWTFLAGAIACGAAAVWLVHQQQQPAQLKRMPMVAGLIATGVWCVAAASTSPATPLALLLESVRNFVWLFGIYSLFASDGRHASVRQVRPVLFALVFVELVHAVLMMAATSLPANVPAHDLAFSTLLAIRLLSVVGGLVLLHNLYVGAEQGGRAILRWPVAALATIWVYDLNYYTVSYLGAGYSAELGALRGLAIVGMAIGLIVGFSKNARELTLRPSRAVTFQTLSLAVIGGYLLLMIGVAKSIAILGDSSATLTQVGFVVAASVLALVWLPSDHMRRWVRVTAIKHLFKHRYDYRTEWLRFTETVGQAREDTSSLHERAIKAVADITDSPAGLLLVPDENDRLMLAANWQWPQPDVPAEAFSDKAVKFFVEKDFVSNLDDVRAGRGVEGEADLIPQWLKDESNAWAIVPLIHYQTLKGVVILARPQMARTLDWEDFDLLRIVGRHLASYLAEQVGQEALQEATRFEEFNRRMAFVMHDIKNLASQLSLLARNAEKHAEKPEFRADMLVTLRNSADKLNALLARLGRYGSHSGANEPLALDDCVKGIVKRMGTSANVVLIDSEPVMVSGNREALDQALTHIVQNGIDASDNGAPVCLRVFLKGMSGVVEVVDSGCGMSPEFVRTKLFKPFISSKTDGFGIGAFEARELIRNMGGALDVESREGLGTRFYVRLPEAERAQLAAQFENSRSEVA